MNKFTYIIANALFSTLGRKSVFSIILMLLTAVSAFSQNILFQKYDSLLLSYKGFEVLKEIDSLLNEKYFATQDLQQVYFYKLKAQIDLEDFEEAIVFANSVDKTIEIDTSYQIKFKIQKALLFEILGDSVECFQELNELDSIFYLLPKESKDYAIFLYRKSSFYRVNGNITEAKKYAEAAFELANRKNYIEEIAVSSMLLAFITQNDKERLCYYNVSLSRWKQTKNTHGATSMYLSIGNVYFNDGNYKKSLLYADSAVAFISSYPVSDLVSSCYKFRSKVYAKLNRFEEAYNDTRLYIESDDRVVQNKALAEADILKYKLDKKEQEELLNEQKGLTTSLKKRLTIIIVVFSVFIILLFVLLYLFRLLAISKKKIEKNNESLISLNKEKNILLKDFQHRTKNDFSLVLSLLELQLSNRKSSAPLKESLTTFKNRIQAIANAPHLVLDLYSRTDKSSHSKLNFEIYIKEIVFSLIQLSDFKKKVETDIININELNADTAIPIGTIINELLTNSIKHAVPFEKELLNIYIRLTQTGNEIKIIFCDNGLIYDNKKNIEDAIGLTIVESMTTQLKGKLQRINSTYHIVLKVKNAD